MPRPFKNIKVTVEVEFGDITDSYVELVDLGTAMIVRILLQQTPTTPMMESYITDQYR